MSARINLLGRQLLNYKGLLINDVNPVLNCVRSVASNINAHSSLLRIPKLIIPSSSEDFKDTSIVKSLLLTSPRPQILDRPLNNSYRIDLPMIKSNVRYEDIVPTTEIQDPKPSNLEEKHAVRMIVIRKRKMRIHKLKKLRKKMKHVWEKVRAKRRAEKEKLFQAELLAKFKEAERFDPAVYVREKIAKANEVLVPKLWHGKRLPEFIIKDLIELQKKKRLAIEDKSKRRKNMNLNASDYK